MARYGLFAVLCVVILQRVCIEAECDKRDSERRASSCINGHYYCGHCSCHHGYEGRNCDQLTDVCRNYHCHNGGSCYVHLSTGSSHSSRSSHSHGTGRYPRCKCTGGYSGTQCDTYDKCYNVVCDHGSCHVNDDHDVYCRCDNDYYGVSCSFKNPCADYDPCQNGGHCYFHKSSHSHDTAPYRDYCSCHHSYTGETCNVYDPCKDYSCHNGGQCYVDSGTNTARCNCTWDHYGTRCDHHDPCHNINCGNGTCHEHSDQPYCTCHSHYYGHRCQYRNPCAYGNPCQHGGSCHFREYDHRNSNLPPVNYCTCYYGYSGETCSIAPTTTSTTKLTTQPPPTTTAIPSTTTTTQSTTSTTTTTTATTQKYTCKVMETITDLANNVTAHNVDASSCSQTDHVGSDAFVLNVCNVTMPSTWKQGQNAMTYCNSMPIYTPVATFSTGHFQPGIDTAGIFLGCIGAQLRVGLQTCFGGTRIEHFVGGGIGYRNADKYYAVQ